MRPTSTKLVPTLAAVFVLGGCGDLSEADDRAAPSPSAVGAAVVVVVDDHDYRPGHVEIRAGQTAAWSFEDRVRHDVAFADGPASPVQLDGVWAREFPSPGTYAYVCTLHPSMTGIITVVG